jgi:hypothetical protein
LRSIEGIWKLFWIFGFWGKVRRRGTHVNIPEIGSRDGECCFGGILRFHADLRRECFRGNLVLAFFRDLGGSPRGCTEEGGRFMGQFVCLGNVLVLIYSCMGVDWDEVCKKGAYFLGR